MYEKINLRILLDLNQSEKAMQHPSSPLDVVQVHRHAAVLRTMNTTHYQTMTSLFRKSLGEQLLHPCVQF